jgi:hypothetical protein
MVIPAGASFWCHASISAVIHQTCSSGNKGKRTYSSSSTSFCLVFTHKTAPPYAADLDATLACIQIKPPHRSAAPSSHALASASHVLYIIVPSVDGINPTPSKQSSERELAPHLATPPRVQPLAGLLTVSHATPTRAERARSVHELRARSLSCSGQAGRGEGGKRSRSQTNNSACARGSARHVLTCTTRSTTSHRRPSWRRGCPSPATSWSNRRRPRPRAAPRQGTPTSSSRWAASTTRPPAGATR